MCVRSHRDSYMWEWVGDISVKRCCNDNMTESNKSLTKRSGQTKISQLQLSLYTKQTMMRYNHNNDNNEIQSHDGSHVYQPTHTSLLINKLGGFKSLCNTLWWWQYATPVKSWYKKLLSMGKSKPVSHTSKYFFKSWSRNSKTNVSLRSVWTTS